MKRTLWCGNVPENDVQGLYNIFIDYNICKGFPHVRICDRARTHQQHHVQKDGTTVCSPRCPLAEIERTIHDRRTYLYYAYIEFATVKAAQHAYYTLHHSLYHNTTIELEWCKSSPSCCKDCYQKSKKNDNDNVIHDDYLSQ